MQVNVDKIEKFRTRRKLSKTEMATLIGYATPGGYSNLIRFRHVPSRVVMRRLSALMKCGERSLLV